MAQQDQDLAAAIAEAEARLEAVAATAEVRQGGFDRNSGAVVWRVWGAGPALGLALSLLSWQGLRGHVRAPLLKLSIQRPPLGWRGRAPGAQPSPVGSTSIKLSCS